jgi:CheY-like chemotaxis protein
MGESMSNKLNILVVDDDEAIRDLFARMLEKTDYQVESAESGEKAVELASQIAGRNAQCDEYEIRDTSDERRFDVAFIDMRMPGMDGLTTLRRLKEINPEMKTVIVTGFAEDEKTEAIQGKEVDVCIKKPFDISSVKEILKEIEKKKWD